MLFCVQVEARLRQLEGKLLGSEAGTAKGKDQPAKYDKTKQAGAAIASVPKAYNADADAPAAAEKKVGGAQRRPAAHLGFDSVAYGSLWRQHGFPHVVFCA